MPKEFSVRESDVHKTMRAHLEEKKRSENQMAKL